MHQTKSVFLCFTFFILTLILPLFAAPSVKNVSPNFGPAAGGTVVTITGTGFSGTTRVKFGEVAAASFIVNSDTKITATTPAHVAQAVSAIVTTASGTSIAVKDSFFVFQGPELAFFANNNGNTVSIIDTAEDTNIINVVVGSNPIAVAVTPDGSKVYAANNTDASVSVIDVAAQTVLTTIPTGLFPYAVAITPQGTRAYVVNNGSGEVTVIDTITDTVVTTVTVGSNPNSIYITPDGLKAYVTNSGSNSVSVIQISDNTVLTTVPVGLFPSCVVVTPDGSKALVANFNSNTVSIINTATDTVGVPIPVGINPCAIAIMPDQTKAYVANHGGASVSVINLTTLAVSTTIPVGNFPDAIAILPNGSRAYVTNNNSNDVSVISTSSDSVLTTVNVGPNPCAIAMTPLGDKAYVPSQTFGSTAVITTSDNSVGMVSGRNFTVALAMTPDQAPLAKFSFSINKFQVSFNASASVSPIGTVVDYFWDFGDGTTTHTASPIISHTYAKAGNYSVVLEVTNSNGTSVERIFRPAASNDVSFNSAFLALNGGLTAFSALDILVSGDVLPPTHVKGKQIKNVFLNRTEYVNVLTWSPPAGGNPPVAYRIYRNAALTDLVGSVYVSAKLSIEIGVRKKGTYTYYIVSVDQLGKVSAPASVTVEPKNKI